ncbi:MAG: 9-O-acetylesterase [Pirellulales bacterium]|nr:9-O-acetylesterase [Pirellulales bacterium]
MRRLEETVIFVLSFFLLNGSNGNADVTLPAIIGDNMVMQQQMAAPIWGWAKPGEIVKVKASWQKSHASIKAGSDGKWMLKIDIPQVGGPHTLTVSGKNSITVSNILIGEVWVCSGQSNMAMTVVSGYNKGVINRDQEVATANYPQIRLFNVKYQDVLEPAPNCQGSWVVCSPATVRSFSATGYFFGREIHKETKLPVGLINASAGGSVIETWCSKRVLESDEDFLPIFSYGKGHHMNPSGLYNGMIAPIMPFAIRGVLWYQGESNSVNAYAYRKMLPALVKGWRKEWGQDIFPFYFAQISPWSGYGDKPISAELREAQSMSLSVPNTGMAVTTDIDDINEIHPINKQVVGERLALWALAQTYNRKDVVFSGPLYKSMEIEGKKVRLHFDYADGGLTAKGGKLTHFTIAGKDRNFLPAEAIIDGDTIIVSSKLVNEPTAVRFGWDNAAVPNLFNKAGLPASPFRTDDWPCVTADNNWRAK